MSVVQGDIHVFLHLVGGGTGNQGSHVHVGIKRVADFDLLGGFDHAFEHGVVQFGHDGHDGPGEAALARGAVAGVDVVFDENVDVGVFHNHKHVFRAAEQHGALGASGAAFGHLFGGRGGPDEAHARDAGIFIPRAGDVAAAVDDVDDAAGQADFHEDFAHELHEVGRLGGRLIDEGVARADGEGDEPAEHQRGEVEGRHAAEHAEGLFRDLAGDAPGDLIEGLALNQRGDGAGHFDDFDDALDFAAGFGNMFRLIERDALSELFQIADHAFPDFMDIGHALGDGDEAPRLVGFGGGGDGGFAGFHVGNGHGADGFAGGRVVQGNRFAARFFLPLAVDEVADLDHGFASKRILGGCGNGPVLGSRPMTLLYAPSVFPVFSHSAKEYRDPAKMGGNGGCVVRGGCRGRRLGREGRAAGVRSGVRWKGGNGESFR